MMVRLAALLLLAVLAACAGPRAVPQNDVPAASDAPEPLDPAINPLTKEQAEDAAG